MESISQKDANGDLFAPATKEERESIEVKREVSSYWKNVYTHFVKNKVAVVSFWFIIAIVLLAIFGPSLSAFRYDEQVKGSELILPFTSWQHPFGTDNLGRDEFVRLMFGARISLAIGVVATLMVVVIGVLYGAVSGYFGGWVDNIMMRIVEIISSVPALLIIILLSVIIQDPLNNFLDAHPSYTFLRSIGGSLLCIFITFALLYWTDMARMVRGQILTVKTTEYVSAARALGARPRHIIKKHLLPNSMGVIIVTATLNIPTAIFTEAYLSFLGIGVSPPMCSLGSLANDGLSYIYSQSFLLIFPSILISLIILAFYLVGDELRDALDPRMKNK